MLPGAEMLKKFIRFVVIVALMAAIALFWLDSEAFREDASTRSLALWGGLSLMAFGMLYKMLGTWDLIPDWIPVLGSVDDFLASLLVLGGLGLAVLGWFYL
jgi:hypothetical protein